MSEPLAGEKSFAIHLEHRPRRVAFVADLGQEAAQKILAGILRFNLGTWGGRHNPIVPLFGGKVPKAYYPLLDVADPDVFYVFGDLEAQELNEIHQRYCPTLVTKHFFRDPVDEHTYDVQLREQAGISRYLVSLQDKLRVPFRHLEPCLLQLQGREEYSLSSFFMWNFGYTSANFFAIQNHNLKGCRPNSLSDHDLLEMLRNERNLVWSINVCGDAPLKRTAGDSWRYYFPIFYGNSPFNIVAYWNDGLSTGPHPIAGEIRHLWLTPEVINDEATYKSLIELLRFRIRSATQQPRLTMFSCDISREELESVGRRLSQDVRGAFYYRDSLNFQPTELAIPVAARRVVSFLPRKGEIEYATGSEIHLAPRHPPEIEENSDQCWMVDVHIYNPGQERWYSNVEPWWRLPRKASLAGIFADRPHRIIFDHRVSFEVSARDATLDFELPPAKKIFRYLLLPQVHLRLADDLRAALRQSSHDIIRLSDKGRYLSGILSLFKTTRDAFYFFEHPFWRSVVDRFSERRPSQHIVKKLSSDIRQLQGNTSFLQNDAEAWLTNELIFASRQMSKLPVWLELDTFQDLHARYLAGLSSDERDLVSRGHDLTSDLSELTRDGVLLQGVALQCPNCMSSYWYSIEEMHKSITCRGCHIPFPLPAETRWSYQLNDLIKAGTGDQGLLPVLRTLGRLFDGARDCFFFTPSVEFLKYTDDDKLRAEQELDLAWIKDGAFGIAEIKTTPKLLKKDYDRLVGLASRVRPDVILIATPEGNSKEMISRKKVIEERLNNKTDVWAWGSEEFDRSPPWAAV